MASSACVWRPRQHDLLMQLPRSFHSLYLSYEAWFKAVSSGLKLFQEVGGDIVKKKKKKKRSVCFFQNDDKKKQVYKYVKISTWLRRLVVTISLLI